MNIYVWVNKISPSTTCSLINNQSDLRDKFTVYVRFRFATIDHISFPSDFRFRATFSERNLDNNKNLSIQEQIMVTVMYAECKCVILTSI